MNPLIEKFEEVYGKKPEPDGLIEQIAASEGKDVISLGGDTVIPTAQTMPGGGINLTGDYITPSAFISNGFTISSTTTNTSTRTFSLPDNTPTNQLFCKVIADVANGKAIVYEVNSQIDKAFSGFGGQIKYTIEIVATYP